MIQSISDFTMPCAEWDFLIRTDRSNIVVFSLIRDTKTNATYIKYKFLTNHTNIIWIVSFICIALLSCNTSFVWNQKQIVYTTIHAPTRNLFVLRPIPFTSWVSKYSGLSHLQIRLWPWAYMSMSNKSLPEQNFAVLKPRTIIFCMYVLHDGCRI